MAKICFIVGHGKSETGGYDSGAVSGNYHEFDIAKRIAKYAWEYYNRNYNEQCDLMNYNGDLYLTDRVKKVNKSNYDFIAEFHLNAGGGSGTECYYYHGSRKGQIYADKICDYISADLGIKQRASYGDDRNFDTDKDGGDKTKLGKNGKDYFAIIRDTKPCAVLIETVFIDTTADLNLVKTSAGQKKCGEAVAKAVAAVRGVAKKSTSTTTTAKKETVSTTATFKKGDVVSIANGATYYGSAKTIPDWVKAKNWIVKDATGNRVVVDKSEDGKESISSAIHSKYLKSVKASGFTPYTVKVITSALNIRSGPGIKYKIVGTIRDKGVYTIVDEDGTWGKLKSGEGWISLNYTKKQ